MLVTEKEGAVEVTGAGARRSSHGPAEWFTGEVWIDEVGNMPTADPVRALHVHFTPGARTAWHTHPGGQVLYIVDGVGRVQAEGEPVREVRPGDTVHIGAGERHWHGASPERLMSHIAMSGGETTIWHEHVPDEQYLAEAT